MCNAKLGCYHLYSSIIVVWIAVNFMKKEESVVSVSAIGEQTIKIASEIASFLYRSKTITKVYGNDVYINVQQTK